MRQGRAALALWLVVAYAGSPSAEDAQRETIDLRVRVYSEIDASWLNGAQAIVERTLAPAAIRVTWIDCAADNTTCRPGPAPDEVVVRIVRRRLDPTSHTCGVALRPNAAIAHYVTLFDDCIREGAKTFRTVEPVVAGHCLAHEIGHLLLPTSAHAPIGIMKSQPDRFDLERNARGSLGFRPAERSQIYESLKRRRQSIR